MGPQNVLMGSDNNPVQMPKTQVPDVQMAEVTNAAKFSQSDEFQKLKGILQSRIDFHKQFIPGNSMLDGIPMNQLNAADRAERWLTADTVIKELQAIIDGYEYAAKEVADAQRQTE